MPEMWRYRGQEITSEQIVFLREFIAARPESSRWKLSRQLCEALGWKQPNGALRDVVCRGLLLVLERAGQIQLPPVRWRIRGQSRRERSRPPAFLTDTTLVEMPLAALGPVEIQLVRRTADEPLFQSLMEQHHYLGYEQPVGEHLKYLVWAQQRPVACLAWSSAPRHLGSRDRRGALWAGLERGSAAAQHLLARLQYALFDSSLGACSASGIPHPWSHCPPAVARLGASVWAPHLFPGNLRRPGPFSRDLLPGCQLGADGAHHGPWQRRSDQSPQPIDQRGVGLSADSAISPLPAGHRGMPPPIEKLDASMEELLGLVEQARPALPADGYQKLKAGIQTLGYVTELLEKQEATLATLRKLLCPPSTEKTVKVLEQAGLCPGEKPGNSADRETTGKPDSSAQERSQATKEPVPGHGRNGAGAYEGAQKIVVPHGLLKKGDACPLACNGKLYPLREPKVLLRIHGQAPIAATQYELERLRCHGCGEIFTATAPPGAGENKYDETAVCMIALLRYGNGFPWNRLEALEANLGIPLPSGTQCDLLMAAAVVLACILQELIRQAAQGEVLHNDDTRMRVLQLERDSDIPVKRTGVFTSGIVSIAAGYLVALYFTGCKHAGENLAQVLKQRAPGLEPPIQMCDALSRNVPKSLQTILANCNAHSRRKFIKPMDNFPEECRFVLESFSEIYHYDDQARERKLSAEERLRFHREHSQPVMEKLHAWLEAQFEEKKVEPNSGLGQAITYLLNHWEPLTLFLRKAGAPLDNNIVERALKQAIRHRKNSLFYKTRKGAAMGDLFMSLIHTCELNKVNPFEYLTELLRHAVELKLNPAAWMPWNYRQNLTQAAARAASG